MTSEPKSHVLSSSGLVVDLLARSALKAGKKLALTPREFNLLAYFLSHPGEALGREQILNEVWNWEFGPVCTVTVHVGRLRTKIEKDPVNPVLIQTVWGFGYCFTPSADTTCPL
ncbi:winged helix-turn-helix domain-containing protein [Streptomyces sp. NPDC059193]|uniref:winged helix-turn-helix domain-containing protein n=1 Tax=Streptomyces sp. NPDC059193 TaxID=3346763 RepID=UPI00368670E4